MRLLGSAMPPTGYNTVGEAAGIPHMSRASDMQGGGGIYHGVGGVGGVGSGRGSGGGGGAGTLEPPRLEQWEQVGERLGSFGCASKRRTTHRLSHPRQGC